MSILMMTSELSYRIANPQIPKLYRIIRTPCQESIKRIRIRKGTLVKLNCVSMALMPIVNCTYRLVSIRIVNNQLLIRTSNDANR